MASSCVFLASEKDSLLATLLFAVLQSEGGHPVRLRASGVLNENSFSPLEKKAFAAADLVFVLWDEDSEENPAFDFVLRAAVARGKTLFLYKIAEGTIEEELSDIAPGKVFCADVCGRSRAEEGVPALREFCSVFFRQARGGVSGDGVGAKIFLSCSAVLACVAVAFGIFFDGNSSPGDEPSSVPAERPEFTPRERAAATAALVEGVRALAPAQVRAALKSGADPDARFPQVPHTTVLESAAHQGEDEERSRERARDAALFSPPLFPFGFDEISAVNRRDAAQLPESLFGIGHHRNVEPMRLPEHQLQPEAELPRVELEGQKHLSGRERVFDHGAQRGEFLGFVREHDEREKTAVHERADALRDAVFLGGDVLRDEYGTNVFGGERVADFSRQLGVGPAGDDCAVNVHEAKFGAGEVFEAPLLEGDSA